MSDFVVRKARRLGKEIEGPLTDSNSQIFQPVVVHTAKNEFEHFRRTLILQMHDVSKRKKVSRTSQRNLGVNAAINPPVNGDEAQIALDLK
ncbi:hypothetical protein RUM43_002531 [Polyplax serrata]|uniref:Uncharacterized protein n=1 Tax=Polyplax serrata TaxID=468196 RepID=A0AAN8S2P1_POLSC